MVFVEIRRKGLDPGDDVRWADSRMAPRSSASW